jgi:hypothetical protein
LPDVKGRTLEEIDELFEKRISIKEFPKYECQSSTQAQNIIVQKLEEKRSGHVEEVEV